MSNNKKPQPFSIYGIEGMPELSEKPELLKKWAETGDWDPIKYPADAAAWIGSYMFDLDRLKEFRNWIDQVILWHEQRESSE